MTPTVQFRTNTAEVPTVLELLERCDNSFVPSLSARVDLCAYARKLCQHAERLEAWSGSNLMGLVAMYCNDTVSRRAFVSSVCVAENWRGKGVAVHLLDQAHTLARTLAFASIELEVDQANLAAKSLYLRCGYHEVQPGSSTLRMQKTIEHHTP